jgi:hypothetical protein
MKNQSMKSEIVLKNIDIADKNLNSKEKLSNIFFIITEYTEM